MSWHDDVFKLPETLKLQPPFGAPPVTAACGRAGLAGNCKVASWVAATEPQQRGKHVCC